MDYNEQLWFLCRINKDALTEEESKKYNDFPERDIAERRTKLWHYTNVEALFKIISGRNLKFSRIDCVNDLSEKELLDVNELFLRTFVSCFTHNDIESIPLWHMYTEKNNGVRIGFEFDNDMIHNRMFDDSQNVESIDEKICWNAKPQHENEVRIWRMIRDVSYYSEYVSRPAYRRDGEKLDIFPDFTALYKSSLWDFEAETRIVLLSSKGFENIKDIFLPIDFCNIKKLSIVFNPWMSSEMKKSIELTTNYYLRDFQHILEFSDSTLSGKVSRKW